MIITVERNLDMLGLLVKKRYKLNEYKKQSLESNIKRSNALKGRIITNETRKKMSEVQKNRSIEDETTRREKIRQHALGRHQTEEVKKELSNIVSNTRWVNKEMIQKKVHKDELAYIHKRWLE